MFKFSLDPEDNVEEYTPTPNLIQPEIYDLNKFKLRAPRISYTYEDLPFRDLFDIKYELMAKTELNNEEKLLLEDTEDVKSHVYEGGLKIWEGTSDLLEVLKSNEKPENSCIELGCGAGLPLCSLFYNALIGNGGGRFVWADYNISVLELLTVPNVILTWLAANDKLERPHGEIVLSSELIDEMSADLEKRGVEITFVLGCWSKEFVDLVGHASFDLVLASETIYNLEYLNNFTNTLLDCLKPGGGHAYVAAKQVYFGVGGGTVEFESKLIKKNVEYNTVLEVGQVGRVVLEVFASS